MAFQSEWDNLKHFKDDTIALMTDYHEAFIKTTDPQKVKQLNRGLYSLIEKAVNNKHLLDKVKQQAPILAQAFQSKVKAIAKINQRSIDRDLS